jgi:hypothetical protein
LYRSINRDRRPESLRWDTLYSAYQAVDSIYENSLFIDMTKILLRTSTLLVWRFDWQVLSRHFSMLILTFSFKFRKWASCCLERSHRKKLLLMRFVSMCKFFAQKLKKNASQVSPHLVAPTIFRKFRANSA